MPDAPLLERVHCLWDELAEFEAAKCDVAVRHLLTSVAGLVDAQNAYWLGAVRLEEDVRDARLGWRPRILRYLHLSPNDEAYVRDRTRSLILSPSVDEATVAQSRLAGSYRAYRLSDLVSRDWFRRESYGACLGGGVLDFLVVGVPVSKTAEGYYGFLRTRLNDPFTEAQRNIALYAMRGLTWFHRKVLLSEGLIVAKSPLSPMERRVLSLLLTEHPEKLIAANLDLAATTLHTYVSDIYRKFGVSGRTGLTALWLGRQT